MLYKDMTSTQINSIGYDRCPNRCADCESNCLDTKIGDCKNHLSNTVNTPFAFVSRCQSVTIGNKRFLYGETIPEIKWVLDNRGAYNEMLDAKIIAVSGMRENNVQFEGKDHNGNKIEASVDMDDVIP